MAAGTNLDCLVKTVRDLAQVTETAWDYAAARDFVRLSQAIERRDRLIEILRSNGDLSTIPSGARFEVLQVLEKTQKMDQDIRGVLESEMALDNQALTDAATKAKALSAYDRLVPRVRKFDIAK